MRLSYRIDYGKKPETKVYFLRQQILIASFLLLFVISLHASWPEGIALLRKYLLGDTISGQAEALLTMVENLRSGESLGDAVTVFCQEILSGY